jgi:hypothetical protein
MSREGIPLIENTGAAMFENDARPRFDPSYWVGRALAVACGLLLWVVMQAHAAVMPGDKFTFDWLATVGPNAGATGSADVTIGAAQASPFFGIATLDVTAAGFCGVCTPQLENLGGAQFDSATFGLLGHVTGSFLGQGGGTHTFDLLLNDIVGGVGTFTFTDTRVIDNNIVVNSGTYTPLIAAVDEPPEMVLLALGFAGIAASRRRKRSH